MYPPLTTMIAVAMVLCLAMTVMSYFILVQQDRQTVVPINYNVLVVLLTGAKATSTAHGQSHISNDLWLLVHDRG